MDEFSELFVEKVKALKVGTSIDPSVQIGPLVSSDGLAKVEEHVNDAVPAVAQAPFWGIKESGMGSEGGYQGLDEYLEEKYILMGIEV